MQRDLAWIEVPGHVMRHCDEASLAWRLIEASRQELGGVEASSIFIALGAGDVYPVIVDLLRAYAQADLLLESDLIAQLHTWLDCYAGSPDEQLLQNLIHMATQSGEPMADSAQRTAAP